MAKVIEKVSAAPEWNRAQKWIAALVAFAILLDGFDTQLMALTLPAIASDWRLDKSAFAGILAIGTVGVAIGSAFAGYCNDRFGRRPSLIASMVLIGLANLAIAQTGNIFAFGIFRFVIGLAIGAAFASATTALAEFTPAHRRSMMISFGILCMPLGGLTASTTCAGLLEALGWQAMFLIGGVLPLAFAGLLALSLPETPAFLSTRPHRKNELERVQARLAIALEPPVPRKVKLSFAGVLAQPYRRDTLLFWLAFFLCMLATYIGLGWIPSLFSNAGGSLALSSAALAANGIGAISGSVLCVLFVQRLGTKVPMIVFGLIGALLLAALGLIFGQDMSVSTVFALLVASSLAIAVTQNLLYVLLAQIYPAALRGSGVGIGMAVGRMGAVASAFVGGWTLQRGGAVFFLIDAAILLLAVIVSSAIGRHVAGTRRDPYFR